MEFFVRHWYAIVGITLGALWIVLFIARDRIKSVWIKSVLGLSLEDPVLKAAMQGRKDFSTREWVGWAVVVLVAVMAIVADKFLFRNL